jgi:hypothetical protein
MQNTLTSAPKTRYMAMAANKNLEIKTTISVYS